MTSVKRVWIPALVVIVVITAGAAVARIRTYFGAAPVIVTPVVFGADPHPYHPKHVAYEVWGSGTYADINYLDPEALPRELDRHSLPWLLEVNSTAMSVSPIVIAQGDGTMIGCRISIDGTVKAERTSTGVGAHTFCSVKAG